MRRYRRWRRFAMPTLFCLVLLCSKTASAQQVGTGDGTGAAAARPHTIQVWEAGGGGGVLTLKGHSNGIVSAAFAPRGDWVVTGSGDRTARVWDAGTGALLMSIERTGFNSCYAAVSPDGSRILTSNHGYVKIWDAKTGRELLDLTQRVGLLQYW